MKKKLLIALGILSFAIARAQSYPTIISVTGTMDAAEDTLTNTDTAYIYFNSVTLATDLEFKLTVTKISGTVGGAALLQGSSDRSQWYSVNSDRGYAATGQFQDTATVTNGTASYRWKLQKENASYPYYRIRVISSGTQVSAPTATMYSYFRKQ